MIDKLLRTLFYSAARHQGHRITRTKAWPKQCSGCQQWFGMDHAFTERCPDAARRRRDRKFVWTAGRKIKT